MSQLSNYFEVSETGVPITSDNVCSSEVEKPLSFHDKPKDLPEAVADFLNNKYK